MSEFVAYFYTGCSLNSGYISHPSIMREGTDTEVWPNAPIYAYGEITIRTEQGHEYLISVGEEGNLTVKPSCKQCDVYVDEEGILP